MVIHPGQLPHGRFPMGAMDFVFRQGIRPSRCRMYRSCKSGSSSIAHSGGERDIVRRVCMPSSMPAFHHLDERDVGFGDGLKEPVFLQKLLVLRVPHKRQVRVQHQSEMALHGITPGPWSDVPPAPGFSNREAAPMKNGLALSASQPHRGGGMFRAGSTRGE